MSNNNYTSYVPVAVVSPKLTYEQKREVKDIVNAELNKQSYVDSFRKLLEHAQFNQMVKNKVDDVVPKVGEEWARNNLKIQTESIANTYMRNNFTPFFRREIADNKEVQGFISGHLKQVDAQVTDTTEKTVKRIVDTSSKFNPIFQQHLEILGERNKVALAEQSDKITKSLNDMNKIKLENSELRKRTLVLEKSNNMWAGISTMSLMGVIGLGVHAYISSNRS